MSEVLLDVGCGENVRPGHIGVDVRAVPGVTIVCDAWELTSHFAENSVDGIFCRHFFEHLTFAQGEATLAAFLKVLKPKRRVQLIVPDIRFHISQFLEVDPSVRSIANPTWSAREHALAGFWGWQREGKTELWDVHKSGYDERQLAEALRKVGFVEVCRLADKPWNLSMSGCKAVRG